MKLRSTSATTTVRRGSAGAVMLWLVVAASSVAAQSGAASGDSLIREEVAACARTDGEAGRLRCYETLANDLVRNGDAVVAWVLMPHRLRAVIARAACEDIIRALSFAPSTYRRIAARHAGPLDDVTIDFEVANRIGVLVRGIAECRFLAPMQGGEGPRLLSFAIDGRDRGAIDELQRIVEAGIDDRPLFLQRGDDTSMRPR